MIDVLFILRTLWCQHDDASKDNVSETPNPSVWDKDGSKTQSHRAITRRQLLINHFGK